MASKRKKQAHRRNRLILILVIILALAGGVFLNSYRVRQKTRPAEARTGGTLMQLGDGITMNVKDEGSGDPIVLIHGFGAGMDWWDDIEPQLAKTHRVVSMDLIGNGGTTAPLEGFEIENQASHVAEMLGKLGVKNTVVVGHSMGGEVATSLAEQNPGLVSRLVLIDTPAEENSSALPSGYKLITLPGVGPTLFSLSTTKTDKKQLESAFEPGFAIPDKFVADLKQLTYSSATKPHDDSKAFRGAKPVNQRVSDLGLPLLVFWGQDDQIASTSDIALYQQVSGAKVITFPGVGHSPMVEVPDKVLADLVPFIDQSSN